MKKLKVVGLIFGVALLAGACGSDNKEVQFPEQKPLQKLTDTTSFSNNINAYSDRPGVVGILNVPEMLVLSVMDSAALEKVSDRIGEDYDRLQSDIALTGAEINGPTGMISHNNNIKNYKFETVVCIKRIPAKQPKNSTIVILEAAPMLVFNFYGSYKNLFSAYNKIKKYCEQNNLTQSGLMREFYMTDPATEKNPDRWLTRLMMPVVPSAKKEKE